MINRASVQLWGIVGQSAGPPKWAGKKKGLPGLLPFLRHGSDFIYTKNAARPGSGFYLHKECRAAEIRVSSTQRIFVERNRELSRIYFKIISALRAPICEEFRKKMHKRSMHNGILSYDIVQNFRRCARYFVKKFVKEES